MKKTSQLVILIAVLFVGYLIVQNNKSGFLSQNTEYKTYTNSSFGYEIKYPTDFSLDDISNPVIESSTRDIAEIKSAQVRIGIFANKNVNSIDNECQDVSKFTPSVQFGNNKFNVRVSETAITDLGEPDFVHRDYYLKTQSRCYLITASYPPSLPQPIKDKFNSQIENIVATFVPMSESDIQKYISDQVK